MKQYTSAFTLIQLFPEIANFNITKRKYDEILPIMCLFLLLITDWKNIYLQNELLLLFL